MTEPSRTQRARAVVVGVDGSDRSLEALRWAAEDARRRALPLRVVHAWEWPVNFVPLAPAPPIPDDERVLGAAQELIDDALAEAERVAPDVPRSGELVAGSPGAVLVDASADAAVVVVGDRGAGGFAGLIVGSSGLTLAAHAASPVVVVRGRAGPEGPVVVGVDGSEQSERAIALALDEARLRGTTLLAVHVIEPPLPTYGFTLGVNDMLASARANGFEFVDKVVAPWREKAAGVTIETGVMVGSPGGALVDATSDAQLVVVGSRGLHGLKRMLLGSTGRALLHHAACPVMVEPATATGAGPA